ncbi:hypothetical protein J6590_098314 [Homalodisca vitripennis]|nr:hypothetical protein J6590_029297 [Homalodisca vitripennis]KAG8260380.1 hypothetical protein J6590_098314 [Homalodisca vitripennis]
MNGHPIRIRVFVTEGLELGKTFTFNSSILVMAVGKVNSLTLADLVEYTSLLVEEDEYGRTFGTAYSSSYVKESVEGYRIPTHRQNFHGSMKMCMIDFRLRQLKNEGDLPIGLIGHEAEAASQSFVIRGIG